MRYLLTIAYDGSKFNGFQTQLTKNTVQDNIEDSLKRIFNKKIKIVASGRTDSKVHAYNQKAHFDLDKDIPVSNIKKALNDIIDPSIRIRDVEIVSNDFHARFDVKEKTYVYKINLGEHNPLEKDYVYQYGKSLNEEEIRKSFQYIGGTRDFKAFTKANDIRADYTRTISKIELRREMDYLILSFTGNGFMRYMVRNIVGTLIEVGENKKTSDDIKTIIESKNRKKAGKTAPGCGLYLVDVKY